MRIGREIERSGLHCSQSRQLSARSNRGRPPASPIEALEPRQLLSATLVNLVNFPASPVSQPVEGLVLSNNTLFGVTENFQIFSVPLSGGVPKLLAVVPNANRNLLLTGGKLYGTTSTATDGTVFSVPIGGGAVTTLATFDGFDGLFPNGNLIRSGNTLFGTTQFGGDLFRPTENFPTGNGVVYSVPIGGGEINDLGQFDAPEDGSNPKAGVILKDNTLFGTASQGGVGTDALTNNGTVFSVPVGGGQVRGLASFQGGNGQDPEGELLFNNGTLYGLTVKGGSANAGTVFSIPVGGGTIKTISSLDGVHAGNPNGAPIVSGNRLYFASFATATVCSVPIAGGSVTVERQFDGNGDGRPDRYLVADSAGNLYGTTNEGGPNHMMGNGSIFKISGSSFGKRSISGTVFDDQNSNGTQDSTEPGLAGATVFLDSNNNGIHDAGEPCTLTDSNGAYAFTGLSAGTYHVRVVTPGGFFHVAKSADHFDVTLATGAIVSGDNFALTTAAPVPVAVTGAATSITSSSATLNASVNPNGLPTTTKFQVSTDPKFGPTTLASGLDNPFAVATDKAGDVFVTNIHLSIGGPGSLRKILPNGTITTVGSGLMQAESVALDSAGDAFVINGLTNGFVTEFRPGLPSRTLGLGFLIDPSGVALGTNGDVFVLLSEGALDEIHPNGSVTAPVSGLGISSGLAADAAGDFFVSGGNGKVIEEVHPDFSVTTVATGFSELFGIAVDKNGNLFVADAGNGTVDEIANGITKTLASGLNDPQGVAVDGAGNVFVTEASGQLINLTPSSVAAVPTPLTGTTAAPITAKLTGLKPNTHYFYRAVATSAGGTFVDSSVHSFTTLGAVTTAATPAFSQQAGNYINSVVVNITSATSGAVIHFTTNGTTPTAASPTFKTPITISATSKIEAIAIKPGLINSAVASAVYTIVPSTAITTLTSGKSILGLFGGAGSQKFFQIVVPSGKSSLTVTLSSGTGNANIFIRKSLLPSTQVFQLSSTAAGNNESIILKSPVAGTYFILLSGVLAFKGVALKATIA